MYISLNQWLRFSVSLGQNNATFHWINEGFHSIYAEISLSVIFLNLFLQNWTSGSRGMSNKRAQSTTSSPTWYLSSNMYISIPRRDPAKRRDTYNFFLANITFAGNQNQWGYKYRRGNPSAIRLATRLEKVRKR